ncbi:pyrroline-5-carboxylate reductase [Roseisolibacter agri]|uniref:Pyrroline-5-carboxylate reductase n=1 Tax=Roseisolibacter agri TaxID=2014610 RepID=A0AA37V3A4_9BACT|nr:pyrroline-5-carboxylate reductase [Roseisolibacter agri]GLC26427.1 pyrroline-5-carboxylate reductase [Roseisolibacter agri]
MLHTSNSSAAAAVAQLDGASLAGRRLALIGAGTMGRAIAGGLQRAGAFPDAAIAVVDHHDSTARALASEIAGAHVDDLAGACRDADVVLLCVKPKDVAGVLATLRGADALAHAPLLISIAAGVSIATLEAGTGGRVPVIRAMPNTASQIGRGCTVVSRGALATDEHLAIAETIFTSVGRCLALDERHLDAVTAVSASGPAFIYVVLEALTDGAVSCGLPRDAAMELVARMTQGAAEMVLATGRHPAALKDDVTTPGGCTIAGLMVLEDGRARSVLARTIETTARVAAGLGR